MGSCIGPCHAQGCCWRWALQQVLIDYAAVKGSRDSLKVMLDEELGQSAKQRLVDLESEHSFLISKWHATLDEMSLLQRRYNDLEHDHHQLLCAQQQATDELKAAQRYREELESRTAALEVEFEAKLNAAYCPTRADLQEMLEEERANVERAEAGVENASRELLDVRIQRTDLEWKVHQLRLALARKGRLRRRRRGVGKSKVPSAQASKRLHRGGPTPL